MLKIYVAQIYDFENKRYYYRTFANRDAYIEFAMSSGVSTKLICLEFNPERFKEFKSAIDEIYQQNASILG